VSQELTPLEQELGNAPGVGLTLEQIRAIVSQAHDIALPKDDAILMIATILNAYLTEIEKLHGRHEKGLTRLMAEKTEEYISGVQEVVIQLSSSLSSASVEGVRHVFDNHTTTLKTFKSNVYLATIIVGMSALLNVAVFIFRATQ
jgi:hypothetical protein